MTSTIAILTGARTPIGTPRRDRAIAAPCSADEPGLEGPRLGQRAIPPVVPSSARSGAGDDAGGASRSNVLPRS